MGAVNRISHAQIFSRQAIEAVKQQNQGGRAFPPLQLAEGESITFGGRAFSAGAIMEFDASGQLIDVAVPAEFTPANAQGKTLYGLYRYGEDGELRSIVTVLSEAVTINGKEYAAGSSLEFQPQTGALLSVATTLTTEVTVNGTTIPAGADLTAAPSGVLIKAAARLTAETDVHGIKFRANSQLTFEHFTATGMDVEGVLSQDTTLQVNGQAVAFKAGSRLRHRYMQGEPPQLQVLGGTLAQPYTIPGTQTIIPAGTDVSWSPEGKPEKIALTTPLTVDGREFPAGTTVWLGPDGHVASTQLSADTMLMVGNKQVIFKAGTTVMFDLGQVSGGTLAENGAYMEFRNDRLESVTVNSQVGIRIAGQQAMLPPGSKICYSDDDKVEMIVPGADLTIDINGEPITFQAGSSLYLYEDATVESGHFVATDNLLGLEIEADGDIFFNEDGTPQRIVDGETGQITRFDGSDPYTQGPTASPYNMLTLLGIVAGRTNQ
jgi:hypothetical protein